MKYILSFFIVLLIAIQTFSINDSIGLGLSIKNLLMIALTAGVLVRLIVTSRLKADLVSLQLCFLLLVLYGTLTYLIRVFVAPGDGYAVLEGGIGLKIQLYDLLLFFVLFFYGLSTLKDTLLVTDSFLAAVVLANVITVVDTSGLLPLGVIRMDEENLETLGRVQGAFGEANSHAAIVVMLLPAVFARAIDTRGLARLFWTIGVGAMAAALLMTASRGGVVGLVVGVVWGLYLFRRFVPMGRVAAYAGVATITLTLIIVAFSATYTDLLVQRFITTSTSGDAASMSSGRSFIWAEAMARMVEEPWSFISGYGWNAYANMGFEYATHNQYIYYLFNLGAVGLFCWLGIIFIALLTARRAAESCVPPVRSYFIAFVIGYLSISTAVFFVELNRPWYFAIAYLALTMRAAVCLRAEQGMNRDADERAGRAADRATSRTGLGAHGRRRVRRLPAIRG